ncbi:MAG: carboxypeptidase regulatory-like domain-containing protein [Planctomycetota bacterium]
MRNRASLCVWICALTLLSSRDTAVADWTFVRGDANGDGVIQISDPIHLLTYLFQGGAAVSCYDAFDLNDSGAIDIADAIYSLSFQFSAGLPPPSPFPVCGMDPTPDALSCDGPLSTCPEDPLPPPAPVLDPHFQFTAAPTFSLSGTAVGAADVVVETSVGSVTAPVSGGVFQAMSIPLALNSVNFVYVTARDVNGLQSPTAQTMIFQDSQPPQVSIQSPAAGAQLLAPSVEVLGTVSDALSGALGFTVTVNGIPASIDIGLGTTGTFLASPVPLALGTPTVINVIAADGLGNTVAVTRTVERIVPPPGQSLLYLLSGSGQSGVVGAMLPEALVVEVFQSDGSPFANKLVEFRVDRNNCYLNATGGPTGTTSFATMTDAFGHASVRCGLGSTAGEGVNRVIATSAGVLGEAVFCASSLVAGATQINIGDGNYQYGETSAPAPFPLRAWVSDGVNGVADVTVIFEVVAGGGTINGLASFPFASMSTGHVEATLVLGPMPGENVVDVRLASDPTKHATFTIYGVKRDFDAPTRFVGTVLDNASAPLVGATVTLQIGGDSFATTSDGDGAFRFENVPVAGPGNLRVDGASATALGGAGGGPLVPGSFPSISYPVVVIPNAENQLPQPVLLPPLAPQNRRLFNGSADVELTAEGVEGFSIYVPASTQIVLADGTSVATGSGNSVELSIDLVQHDDLPMAVPDGAAPLMAWTLQPAGAHFNPPLRVVYPNVSALPPGAIAYFLSYNHANNRFEIVATGKVTLDGASIESDPGVGLSVAGWGCNCPPYAVTSDCEEECTECPPELTIPDVTDPDALAMENNPILWTSADPTINASLQDLQARVNTLRCLAQNLTAGARIYTTSAYRPQTYQDHLYAIKQAYTALQRLDPDCQSVCAQQIARINAECAHHGICLNPVARVSNHSAGNAADISKNLGTLTQVQLQTLAAQAGLSVLVETRAYHLQPSGAAGTCTPGVLPAAGPAGGGGGLGTGLEEPEGSGDGPEPDLGTLYLRANGQSFSGVFPQSFRIRNISVPDQFGLGGPGTAPDFVSDDAIRVIGVRDREGVKEYFVSDEFRIVQGLISNPPNLVVSPTPPPLPERITLAAAAPGTTVEVGSTKALNVTGFVLGATIDLTANPGTAYRTTNPAIATVDAQGIVTGLLPGSVVIAASNNGAIAALRLSVQLPVPRTDVVGFAMLSVGRPLAGVSVEVLGTSSTGVSDSTGFFELLDVDVLGTDLELLLSVDLGGETLQALATITNPQIGGITDAGVVVLAGGPAFLATSSQAPAGGNAIGSVLLDTDLTLRGWSLGLCHDATALAITGANLAPFMSSVQGGQPADFVIMDVIPGSGVTMGVVIDVLGGFTLAPGLGYWLFDAEYDVIGAAGTTTAVCFCDTIGGGGAGPVQTVVTDLLSTAVPTDNYCGSITIAP